MFLLYVDESGEAKNKNEEYFVLGGIAIYERQAFFLSRQFDDIQNKHFPSAPDSVEFHASKMRNRNEEPWHSLDRKKCLEIMFDLCEAITQVYDKGLYLFGVAVHKASFPNDDPVEKAFYELCGHFDKFIEQKNLTLDKREANRGLMILDSAKYQGSLDRLLSEYRELGGTKFGRVKNFADVPTFADSRSTRLLQAADLVSYAIYRRYEKNDATFMDRIAARFYESDGTLHGLVHQIAQYRTCPCAACISRR